MARLARLGWPRGVKIRQQPCTVHAGNKYKVRHYKREVLITLVSVLDIIPLAIIYVVACVYNKWLKVGYFIS